MMSHFTQKYISQRQPMENISATAPSQATFFQVIQVSWDRLIQAQERKWIDFVGPKKNNIWVCLKMLAKPPKKQWF